MQAGGRITLTQEGEQSEGVGTAKCPRTGQCACGSKPACSRWNRSRTCALQCGRTDVRYPIYLAWGISANQYWNTLTFKKKKRKRKCKKRERLAGWLAGFACGLAPMEATRLIEATLAVMGDDDVHVIGIHDGGTIRSMFQRENQQLHSYYSPPTCTPSWGQKAIKASSVRTRSMSPSISPHLFAPRSASPHPSPRSARCLPPSHHPAPRSPLRGLHIPLSSAVPHIPLTLFPFFRSPC